MNFLFLLDIFSYNLIQLISASTFPADQFFNISSAEIEKFSHYLCNIKPKETKCCNCDWRCFQDCCIDYLWRNEMNINLDEYLQKVQQRHLQKQPQLSKCISIINPLIVDHESESMVMTTSYYSEDNDQYLPCPLNMSVLNIPVYGSDRGEFYINKQCAVNDGDSLIKHLILLVQCSYIPEISNDTVFDYELYYKISKCRFKLERSSFIEEYLFEPCMKHVDKCAVTSKYYKACQMYAAKTANFKNPHCKKCIMDPFDKEATNLELPNIEKSCFSESLIKRPTSFQLRYNSEDGALRVKNLNRPFPFEIFLDGIVNMKAIPLWLVSCEYPETLRCCSCSRNCFLYSTCCADVIWKREHPISMTTYKKHLVEKAKISKHVTCQPLIPGLNYEIEPMKKVFFSYMVANCSHNSTTYMKMMCRKQSLQNYDSFIPVIGEDEVVYRNRFCAECNSVKIIDVVNITVFNCLSTVLKFTNSCVYRIRKNDIMRYDIQVCSPLNMDSTGNCTKDNSYFDLCNAYSGSIGHFRNHHCDLCNNMTVLRESFDCFSLPMKFMSWSSLISFSTDFTTSQIESTNGNKCRQDLVSSYHNTDTNLAGLPSCLPKESRHELHPDFKTCVERKNLSLFMITNNTADYHLTFLKYLNISVNITRKYHVNKKHVVYRIDGYIEHKRILQHFQKNMSYFLSHNVSLVFTHAQRPLLSEFHHLSFANTFSQGLCHIVEPLNLTLLNFTEQCNVLLKGQLYEYDNISFEVSIENGEIHNLVYVCEQFYMKPFCSLKELKGNLILDKNGSVSYFISGEIYKMYSPKEYYPLPNGVAVCLGNHKRELMNEIERYITIIGTPLSCLCYILLLPILWTFSNFQNISGRCSMALTMNLLIADSSFFVAGALYDTSYATNLLLCKCIAIVTHFALTLTHSWTTVMSYNMMIKFSTLLPTTDDDMKKFSKYAAVTFLYSTLIVGVSVWFDMEGIVKSGYGDNGICTFSIFNGRLYFYIIPTIFSFILTLIFSLICVFRIMYTMNVTQQILERNLQNRKQIVKIALSLVFILGISEGIGFIQVTNGNQDGRNSTFRSIINLTYSFVRALRGVFLFIVFACKKDTRKNFMQKCCAL